MLRFRVDLFPHGYNLIAGVFKVPENAQSFYHSLMQKGFRNVQIIQSGQLRYVCIDNFTSRPEALAMLDSLKTENLSAWILKKD